MSRRILGTGLKDIFELVESNSNFNSDLISASVSDIHQKLKMVFPHEIHPGAYQPRRDFDQNSLQELAASIKEKGILQPLTVREVGVEYELIAGERRWRAAQLAGLKLVPIIACNINNNDALAFSLIENIQRQDLNPIEEATALKRLLEEFTMTHEAVAKSIGRSRAMVTNMLRLLNLAEPVKAMLITKRLEMGHARALLSLSQEQQINVASTVVAKHMTVRATENYVRSLQANSIIQTSTTEKPIKVLELEQELFGLLKPKTKIQINAKGEGKLTCYFSSIHDMEALIKQLR